MVKIGLDWCLKAKIKEGSEEIVKSIVQRMEELNDKYDWDVNPAAKEEFDSLNDELHKHQIQPEESVGMMRLKDKSPEEQKKAFEKYAVPKIRAAQNGEGHQGFINHWKEMTFDRFIKEKGEAFLEGDMPEEMENMPRVMSPLKFLAGAMSFRGKAVGCCDLIPRELQSEAYYDMTPTQMLEYADRLEKYAQQWEKDNATLYKSFKENEENVNSYLSENDDLKHLMMDETQKEEHKKNMASKYGYMIIGLVDELRVQNFMEYKILRDAITWLRFWGQKGHGMHAWN